MTRILPLEPREASLAESATVLRAGGLVAFRTDTLYGLTASPLGTAGMDRLRALKLRAGEAGFVSLAGSLEAVRGFSAAVPGWVLDLAAECWPGPVTLVLPAGPSLPEGLRAADGSWAVRVPAHAWCARLAGLIGAPLPSSSANRPGQPPAKTAVEAVTQLGESLDLVIDGGPVPPDTPPSALVDCRAWPPRLLRGESAAVAEFVRRRAELDPH